MTKNIAKNLKTPPKESGELERLFNQILGFQTPRLAGELWEVGERILRKEKAWNSGIFSPKQSSVSYNRPEEYYIISHIREIAGRDSLYIFHIHSDGNNGWAEDCTTLPRKRLVGDFPHKTIMGAIVNYNVSGINRTPFAKF